MKIALGKFYRTRSGVVVGPIKANTSGPCDEDRFPFKCDGCSVVQPAWTADGRWHDYNTEDHSYDLVAEVGASAEIAISEEQHTLVLTGTRGEVIEAFFSLPHHHQAAALGALLDRASGR